MGTKRIGTLNDLLIHPGETLSDAIEARGMSQAELAARTGVSEAFVSALIHGKKNISSNYAAALEYALGVSKSFWLNLQANYDAELIDLQEMQTVDDEEICVWKELNEVTKYLKTHKMLSNTKESIESIIEARRFFKVSKLTNLSSLIACGAFRIKRNTTINPCVLGAWVRMCQIDGENMEISSEFDKNALPQFIQELKEMMHKDWEEIKISLPRTMARYGIHLSIMPNFRGAPVQGYIEQKTDTTYHIAITNRGKFAGIFWFSLFHELGHIVNGDVSKQKKFIDNNDDENKEEKANMFANENLIDPVSYTRYISNNDFNIHTIRSFANDQKVPLFIVIERLQKEKKIGYPPYNKYKVRYN